MKKTFIIIAIISFAAATAPAFGEIKPLVTLYPGDALAESSSLAGNFQVDSDMWLLLAYGPGDLSFSFSCEEGTMSACVGGGLIAYGGGIVSYGMTVYMTGIPVPIPLHVSVGEWGLYIMPSFFLWAEAFPATYYIDGGFTP